MKTWQSDIYECPNCGLMVDGEVIREELGKHDGTI